MILILIILLTSISFPQNNKCGYIDTIEVRTSHYESSAGKLLGIWPWALKDEEYSLLFKKYGVKGWFAQGENPKVVRNAIQIGQRAGFDLSSMIINIDYDSYEEIVNNFSPYAFYIDEPTEHNCFGKSTKYSLERIKEVSSYVKKKSKSLLIMTGYKRCSHFEEALKYFDKVMYSAYSEWIVNYAIPCNTVSTWGSTIEAAFIQAGKDQRSSWSDLKNDYPKKFSSVWINSLKDMNEFDDLFGHSNNLGIKDVWVYLPDGGYKNEKDFERISDSAWKNGYLKKYNQKVKVFYKCRVHADKNKDCICFRENINCNWEEIQTSEIEKPFEVFH